MPDESTQLSLLEEAQSLVDDGDGDRVLTVREAAACTGRNERTIQRWIADGRLPSLETNRGKAVRVADLDACLAAASPRPTSRAVAIPTIGADVADVIAVGAVGDTRDMSSPSSPVPRRASTPRGDVDSQAIAQALAVVGGAIGALQAQMTAGQETSYRAGAAEAARDFLAEHIDSLTSERDALRAENTRLQIESRLAGERLTQRENQLAVARSQFTAVLKEVAALRAEVARLREARAARDAQRRQGSATRAKGPESPTAQRHGRGVLGWLTPRG